MDYRTTRDSLHRIPSLRDRSLVDHARARQRPAGLARVRAAGRSSVPCARRSFGLARACADQISVGGQNLGSSLHSAHMVMNFTQGRFSCRSSCWGSTTNFMGTFLRAGRDGRAAQAGFRAPERARKPPVSTRLYTQKPILPQPRPGDAARPPLGEETTPGRGLRRKRSTGRGLGRRPTVCALQTLIYIVGGQNLGSSLHCAHMVIYREQGLSCRSSLWGSTIYFTTVSSSPGLTAPVAVRSRPHGPQTAGRHRSSTV